MINNMTNNNKQTNNKKQIPKYKSNLEDRTLDFSKKLLAFCRDLPKNNVGNILISQVVRSGTSIGANYREANDKPGKKDFVNRLRIARKEAKETSYWLELLQTTNNTKELRWLIQSTIELRNILSTIISKSI